MENTNLRANAKQNDVTYAESIKTCQTESFFGREYIQTIERLNGKIVNEGTSQVLLLDRRNKKRKRVTLKDVSILYGQRPNVPELWFLSPYEFVAEWEPVLASYPTTLGSLEDPRHHATLTETGIVKLHAQARGEEVEMIGGADYVVKSGCLLYTSPSPRDS